MSAKPRTLHQHIRSGEWTWCGIRWKHAAQSPGLPFCKWCVKSARKSGVVVDAPLDGPPLQASTEALALKNSPTPAYDRALAREMGSMHGRDAAPSVAEKLPEPPPRLPTYEEFLAGQFGSPWTVALGNLWAAYSERQARERGTR